MAADTRPPPPDTAHRRPEVAHLHNRRAGTPGPHNAQRPTRDPARTGPQRTRPERPQRRRRADPELRPGTARRARTPAAVTPSLHPWGRDPGARHPQRHAADRVPAIFVRAAPFVDHEPSLSIRASCHAAIRSLRRSSPNSSTGPSRTCRRAGSTPQRLAVLHRHRAQPHPRRHHPPAPDRRRRPDHPARPRVTLHLPEHWSWQHMRLRRFTTAHAVPV